MYKSNFKTYLLPWEKALELLNKLAEHMIDTDGDGEIVYYIQCKVNEKTKNYLYNLGIDLNKLGKDFYNPKEGWFDLMPVWNEIQNYYGHNLYYNGKELSIFDEEKEQLFNAASNVTEHLELFADQNDIGEFPDLENLYQILQKIEENNQVFNIRKHG